MVYVYVPERTAADPADTADDLSESLSNQYGSWQQDTSAGTSRLLELAMLPGGCRNSALHVFYSFINNDKPQTSFSFNFASPIDMRALDKFQFGWLAQTSGNVPPLKGTGHLELLDTNLNIAGVAFSFPTDKTPVQRIFTKDQFLEFPYFDWSKVIGWFFILDLNVTGIPYGGVFDVWVDCGPFARLNVVPPTLTVLAEDIDGNQITYGKNLQLINPLNQSVTQPCPISLPSLLPIGTYSIIILDADFVRWKQSGSTNPRIDITVTYADRIILTAVFQSGVHNGNGGNQNLLLAGLAVGAVSLLILGSYFFKKKSR